MGLSDDCNILGPPNVVAEVINKLHALAMSEAGLKTQARKNRIYVRPSARVEWVNYLENNPRGHDQLEFSVHDIPDGMLPPLREYEAFYKYIHLTRAD